MPNLFKKNKDASGTSARVVDGKLILSLLDAKNPVLWQMDLTQTKVSALEILHHEEKNIYALTLKTPSGETIEIAPFTRRAQALEGLKAASLALENADGHIRAANDHGQGAYPARRRRSKGGAGRKWLIGIASVIVLFVLFNLWVVVSLGPPPGVEPLSAPGSDLRQSTGVPMSADDFLNSP